jgi:hypothetical protein
VKLVNALDDAAPHGTQTAPTGWSDADQKAVSALNAVVSLVGIEPTTRRLRDDNKLRPTAAGPGKSGPAVAHPGRLTPFAAAFPGSACKFLQADGGTHHLLGITRRPLTDLEAHPERATGVQSPVPGTSHSLC